MAILLLVKRPCPVPEGGAVIHYYDIGDYLSREEKLDLISKVDFAEIEWERITPNAQGDWTNQRSSDFLKMRPVIPQDSHGASREIFAVSSYGVNSGRDAWVYNSSLSRLRGSIDRAVNFFNGEAARIGGFDDSLEHVNRDQQRFSWDRKTEQRLVRGDLLTEFEEGYRDAVYRPFFKQRMYIYPAPETRTPSIVVGRGLRAQGRAPAVIAVDQIPNIAAGTGPSGGACQTLPRYTYQRATDTPQRTMLTEEPSRRDNITDDSLSAYRAHYGNWVTKDRIFSYVYGILHSLDYRERYAADLAKLLPRIPEVSSAESFRAFSEAGQRLLDLHIGYEEAKPYPLVEQLSPKAPDEPMLYRMKKMRWGGTAKAPDHSKIVYNEWITLTGIPDEAHGYTVGPRSALAWLLDRYRVTTNRASGIVNDPNDRGAEMGNPRYIIDLVKRITTVSVETMAIVKALPPIESGA